MTAAPSRTDDTDLLIIGGGPAGCAAALMAASVGMRSILVESSSLCRNLHRIPALNNVLGGFGTGPELAATITADLRNADLCRVEHGQPVAEIRTHDDHVAITLGKGRRRLTAPYAVMATGVGPIQTRDTSWVTGPKNLSLPPLWEADPTEATGRKLLVIGADRPLGTFLRANPETDTTLLVVYPPEDDYKAEEVSSDPRTTLLPVSHVTLGAPTTLTVTVETTGRDGEHSTWTADAAFLSIGSTPIAPTGDLVRDTAGYCPTSHQHPRIFIAGDLRSPRCQRIMTAMGSGSEAALRAYYASQGI